MHTVYEKCRKHIMAMLTILAIFIYRVVQKNGPLVYFDDNFGKYGPI